MGVMDQKTNDSYAIYQGDAAEILPQMPSESIGLSCYSPPFAAANGALYHYSSSVRDLSNSRTYSEFFDHYRFIISEIERLTMPGRITAVHAMDVPTGNTGNDALIDFPGDIIRAHAEAGMEYIARYSIWKEPLTVRNRTMTKALAHKTIVDDSSKCTVAGADYLLCFRKRGENAAPVEHPNGLLEYAGERQPPAEVLSYRGWTGKQTENRYSHWVWRQYASAFWDDVRLDRVLPYREARDDEDERHVHPLQLDVIQRCLTLWSNPGERVLDPFAGVGSVPYMAAYMDRFGVGVELKRSYYRQMLANMEHARMSADEGTLFEATT